jgi:hypothetical protein
MDRQKVQAVLDWPLPQTVRAVHTFLGLAGYYQRFIKGYGTIVASFTARLCKDAFRWNVKAEAAFRALQSALTSTLVLQLPIFNEPFIVKCNVSGMGVGTVLNQGRGPVAFFSWQLTPRHAVLAAYERELMDLVLAVRHWQPYQWGRPFVIKTDHYSLKFLLDQKLVTIPQHQWVHKLFRFDFRVEYKPGATNVAAAALSKRDSVMDPTVLALSTPSFALFDGIRQAISTDPALSTLVEEVRQGMHDDKWRIVDNPIVVDGRVYISADSPSVPEVLTSAHGTRHEGIAKTLHQLQADFHISGARATVQDFVRTCSVC